MKTVLSALTFLSFLAGTQAWADIPPPPDASAAERAQWNKARQQMMIQRMLAVPLQPHQVHWLPVSDPVPLTIICKADIETTRLVLSRKLMKQLGEKVAQAGSQLSLTERPALWPTVIAGLAMSFALVMAGLLLVRSRRRLVFGGVGFLAITICFLGVSCKLVEQNTDETAIPTVDDRGTDSRLKDAVVELSDTEEGVKVFASGHWVGPMISRSGLRLEP